MQNTIEASEGTATELGPVLPKCDDKTATGHWLCITHAETFPHMMALAGHTEEGEHVLAWVCHPHGPEVP